MDGFFRAGATACIMAGTGCDSWHGYVVTSIVFGPGYVCGAGYCSWDGREVIEDEVMDGLQRAVEYEDVVEILHELENNGGAAPNAVIGYRGPLGDRQVFVPAEVPTGYEVAVEASDGDGILLIESATEPQEFNVELFVCGLGADNPIQFKYFDPSLTDHNVEFADVREETSQQVQYIMRFAFLHENY